MDIKEFGSNLARIRASKNISAYELSLLLGKDPSYIHKVESGKINISLKVILQLAETLEINPSDFFK